MPRFFVDKEDIFEGELIIRGQDAFHIARSLRMAVGDNLTVCDGLGVDYDCTLTKIRDDECVCSINSSCQSHTEPRHTVTLYMAYPKGDKLETIIQKAVELGACEIVPFESRFCVKKPKEDKQEKQSARLNRIAVEAAKQCGRGRLPTVNLPLSFDGMLDCIDKHDRVLFCYEGTDGSDSLKGVLKNLGEFTSLGIIVGSEGGFSPDEAEKITKKGAIPVNLGSRILRCETAPSYVLSCVSYEFEM